MEICLVLKAVKKYTAVVLILNRRKKLCVSGNIPEMYTGMYIGLELDGTLVTDYHLELTDKNVAALEKNGVDVKDYNDILQTHMRLKHLGCSWDIAKAEMSQVYEKLSFCDADKLHKELINNAKDPCRLNAIGKTVVKLARNRRKIAYKIEEYLSYFDEVEQEGAYQKLMMSLKVMCLEAQTYSFRNNMVIDCELKHKEDFLKNNLAQRLETEYSLLTASEIKSYVDTIPLDSLEKEQLDVLWCLLNSCPCVVTGGAGVGKTTVIKNVIDCYAKHYKHSGILLLAPTGKASRRLSEKTGMKASTIHKALRKNPEDDYIYYTKANPLPHRLIIVDESSMIDTSLMYDLLNAVDITSKIIFVGDHNQLYPVGYGEPFFDFMKQLRVYRLTVNHRQDETTDILSTANNVLRGKLPISGKGVIVENIPFSRIGEILSAEEQTQILSPYNELNAQINSYLRKGENPLNVGDKVIMLRNTKTYCNGDIGVIERFDSKGNTYVEIEGKIIKVTPAHSTDISLAYAITIHKMQGSECDKIIVFIPQNDSLVDERMLYTAITRAKKSIEIYYYEKPL